MSEKTEWVDGITPYSPRFGDTYYSKADGQAETIHVFIGGNNLEARWQAMPPDSEFSIAELGFGTGLNFIETWRHWRNTRRQGQRLRFTGFEAFPLDSGTVERSLSRWPEIGGLTKQMLQVWPCLFEADDWIELDTQTDIRIVTGDAGQTLPGWTGTMDVWYLDGFAPDKNPDMWCAKLMREVFDHTAPGGTFATYTAAGWVRRNLANAGFGIERIPGPMGKRHMTIGRKGS